MELSPDEVVYFSWGILKINATLVNTWIVMAILVGLSYFVSRQIRPNQAPRFWQSILEWIVKTIEQQVTEISSQAVRPVVYFAGTLFLFIALSNLLLIVPGYRPPTGSLSTTVALTLVVLIAVPLFSIRYRGLNEYLRQFIQPTWLMLPFNLLSEVSRGISLAIRLYGNVMSGVVIVAILLGIAPFFFPVIMEALGLLTGVIQAYIFAILATVYIASALAEPQNTTKRTKQTPSTKNTHNT